MDNRSPGGPGLRSDDGLSTDDIQRRHQDATRGRLRCSRDIRLWAIAHKSSDWFGSNTIECRPARPSCVDSAADRAQIRSNPCVPRLCRRGCIRCRAVSRRVRVRQMHRSISTLKINNDLERIGDHACNISEDVLYLLTGEIVRHASMSVSEVHLFIGPADVH